jgi:hypothetical protein
MRNDLRREIYLRQTGRREPTPRQRRRLAKKAGQNKE